MAKVAVENEESYGLMVFDPGDGYKCDVEIPDDLHAKWVEAKYKLEALEQEIIDIANMQRGED